MENNIVTDLPSGDNSSVPSTDNGASAPVNTPSGQDGTPPVDNRDEQIRQLREHNQKLQQMAMDGRQPGNKTGASDFDLNTPEGQYAVAMEIATGRLGSFLEGIYSLYPEIPAEEIARVRANPWAFMDSSDPTKSRNAYMSADFETAKWLVESTLANRAEQIGAKAPAAPVANPATLSNNPAPQGDGNVPGMEEGADPWTMPMDQLEKVAMKEKAKLSTK